MYVITKGNRYLNMPGSKNTYTTSILRARKFKTKEEAIHEKCNDESILNLYDIN